VSKARVVLITVLGLVVAGGVGVGVAHLSRGSRADHAKRPDDRAQAHSRHTKAPNGDPGSPNVVFVLTDDQAYRGTVKRMPWLHSHQGGFTRFTHAYDNNPLCCPARATILSGLYSHHTHVETNADGEKFDPSSTIATWLHHAGYETGLFGKYLNGFPFGRGADYVPPGWDRFSAFRKEPHYYDYTLRSGDHWRRFGHKPDDYSTRVVGHRALRFVKHAPEPFFAYVAPYGPHRGSHQSATSIPDPRDRHLFRHAPVDKPRNFNRVAKRSPRWWKSRSPVARQFAALSERRAWATLRSEDRLLHKLVNMLRDRGALGNTILVFLSDNGYSFGAHRWMAKQCAYEECIHVPLFIRAPGIPHRTVKAMVGDQDVAPTLAALAGVPHPRVDGSSLVSLMNAHRSSLHRPMLLHHVRGNHNRSQPPTYWAVRTDHWKYLQQKNGSRELYDLDRDPRELRNVIGRPALAHKTRRLAAKLRTLRR
jgi:N-acetylglucosamine-6-sulfatase